MPEISRRDVLAGAAATMAAGALPATDMSGATGSNALDLEALEFEDTPVWARAVLSAFLNAGGERNEFGTTFPHLLPLLDAD